MVLQKLVEIKRGGQNSQRLSATMCRRGRECLVYCRDGLTGHNLHHSRIVEHANGRKD